MGRRGPKHCIFGDQFNSKNGRMIRCHSSIFMQEIWYHHFTWSGMKSHKILSFVLILFGSVSTNNWNRIHNFLEIWSNSGKIMITYVFYHENGGINGIWAFLHFLSKASCQKYSTLVPGDSTPSCFCSVMSLSEEIYKFS